MAAVIIKSLRVRTRGGGVQRTLNHVWRGDENDEVVILRGTEQDARDACNDARQRAREYALRHWIISPERGCTRDEMLAVVDALGAEFGFDPAAATVIEHCKARVHEGLFNRHLHALVPEVDPVTGRVLSSSHSFARQEKVARLAEHALGHPLTPGAHDASVMAALRAEGHAVVADVLDRVAEATPSEGQAFSHSVHQKTKREGHDLPALRQIVSAAWEATTTRTDLEGALAEHGLVVRAGAKFETHVVYTAEGTFLGSLARLAKARKAAVLARLENLDERTEEAARLGSGIHLGRHPSATTDAVAGRASGDASAGTRREELDRDHDRDASGDPGGGRKPPGGPAEDHQPFEPACCREGRARDAEGLSHANDLRVVFEAEPHVDSLHALLARATALAKTPKERVSDRLAEIVLDAKHAVVMASSSLAEDHTAQAARKALAAAECEVERAKSLVDQASLTYYGTVNQRRPWWSRAMGWLTGRHVVGIERQREAMRAAEDAASIAGARRLAAAVRLELIERRHKAAEAAHRAKWAAEAERLAPQRVAAEAAQDLCRRLPGLVHLGAAGLLELGESLAAARHARRKSEIDQETSGQRWPAGR